MATMSLNDKEQERVKQFIKNYDVKNYYYEFHPTGVGSVVYIVDPKSGKRENITDYDSW